SQFIDLRVRRDLLVRRGSQAVFPPDASGKDVSLECHGQVLREPIAQRVEDRQRIVRARFDIMRGVELSLDTGIGGEIEIAAVSIITDPEHVPGLLEKYLLDGKNGIARLEDAGGEVIVLPLAGQEGPVP